MSCKKNAYKLKFLFQNLVFLCFLLYGYQVFAQETHKDTLPADNNTYFTEYPKLLALQLFTQTKINNLDIVTPDQNLKLRPNGMTNLGIAASYYGVGLGVSVGLPKAKESVNKYGKTGVFDVQFSAYSKRFGLDGFIQSYKGYYNANPDDFMDWDQKYYPQIPDMHVLSVGASGFYIFNHEKYSYKAAYKHTAVQHKSAGSFVSGVYGYYDEVNSDYGLIPQEFPDSIKSAINIKGYTTLTGGISFGYMHNFVMQKKFIINISAIPGVGFRQLSLTNLKGVNSFSNEFAVQLQGRIALGYEHKYFYVGLITNATLRTLKYKDYNLDLSSGQFRFFIGKRIKL